MSPKFRNGIAKMAGLTRNPPREIIVRSWDADVRHNTDLKAGAIFLDDGLAVLRKIEFKSFIS